MLQQDSRWEGHGCHGNQHAHQEGSLKDMSLLLGMAHPGGLLRLSTPCAKARAPVL